MNTNELRTTN